MLRVDNLHAFYGKSHVLHGVTFAVGEGEIVALLGRNGSGRSTTAKAVMGMVDCEGSIAWKGQEIVGKKPYQIAHLGLGYVCSLVASSRCSPCAAPSWATRI
jgi:branched-chain amino acid transport system ATP-binding protein